MTENAAPWGVCAACNSGACTTADRLGRKATCNCCATHRRKGPPWPGQRPDVHDHKPQDECPPDCPTRHPEWFTADPRVEAIGTGWRAMLEADPGVTDSTAASTYGTWHRRPEGAPWRRRDRMARLLGYHCWDCWWFA